ASSRHVFSSGVEKWATPDFDACVEAPPSSSNVTSSPVTVFTTSGPVMNMYDAPSTMNTKSVIAGEYTAPPAHGPITRDSCGITPLHCTLRQKISAYPASDTTPSWIRAPPESLIPITGHPYLTARSMILQIFSAKTSLNEPPKTVKSWEKTNTR